MNDDIREYQNRKELSGDAAAFCLGAMVGLLAGAAFIAILVKLGSALVQWLLP